MRTYGIGMTLKSFTRAHAPSPLISYSLGLLEELEKTENEVAQMASILPHLTLQAMKCQGSFQTELLSCEPHHLINVFLKSSLNQIFKIHLIFSVISRYSEFIRKSVYCDLGIPWWLRQ